MAIQPSRRSAAAVFRILSAGHENLACRCGIRRHPEQRIREERDAERRFIRTDSVTAAERDFPAGARRKHREPDACVIAEAPILDRVQRERDPGCLGAQPAPVHLACDRGPQAASAGSSIDRSRPSDSSTGPAAAASCARIRGASPDRFSSAEAFFRRSASRSSDCNAGLSANDSMTAGTRLGLVRSIVEVLDTQRPPALRWSGAGSPRPASAPGQPINSAPICRTWRSPPLALALTRSTSPA